MDPSIPVSICPGMTRRGKDDLGELHADGLMIERNPGVTLLWMTRTFKTFNDGLGGWLIQIGEPDEVAWYREGRAATRAEVLESIESGLPRLVEACEAEGTGWDELEIAKARLIPLVPL